MGFRHYCRRGTRARLLRGERVHWIENRKNAGYIRAVVLSTPDWVDRRELALLAAWARVMTVFTGREHNLDHHVPLRHPHVCGLTVTANLRVIGKLANFSKGNTFDPDQLGLFDT
jgi:hypothetical protein